MVTANMPPQKIMRHDAALASTWAKVMTGAPGSRSSSQRGEAQAIEGQMWSKLWAEIASQVAASQSAADQRLQESLSELKEHISSVLCRQSSGMESSVSEPTRRVVLVDSSSSPSSATSKKSKRRKNKKKRARETTPGPLSSAGEGA